MNETADKKEPEKKERKTVTVDGKKVQTFDLTLPVSGDTIECREVGLLTSREMEMAAGVTKDDYTGPPSAQIIKVNDKLFAEREELYKQFFPTLIITPKKFDRTKYVDDDLWGIITTCFNRGARQGGGSAARTFLPNTLGEDGSGDGGEKEPAGK